ncbi:hypothetical protein [Massilia sp. TS11]|uniref:hypothetical protein n=1 Tax=Massilia sp. TS11 TaxID=2908003 RepID=UPI001EDB6722|nr:hypothetical protein [Massilia sp. TS11]MCG2585560.1 hypothetical protein [Massilia sp. TS11]
MRLIPIAAGVAACLCAAFAAAAPLNYTGTWTLDKAASQSLPAQFAAVERQQLVTYQDSNTLKVSSVSNAGGKVLSETVQYATNGSDTEYEALNRNRLGWARWAPAHAQMAFDEQGRAHLGTAVNTTFFGAPVRRTMQETWQLSPDGSTLTIQAQVAGHDATLVYHRDTSVAAR